MFTKWLRIASALLGCAAIAVSSGCSACKGSTKTVSYKSPCSQESFTATTTTSTSVIPTATVGECYAHVWVAPQLQTVSERILVKEAAERLEIIPAEYAWVEEKVLAKEASTFIEEIPAQFEMQERQVQVDPGHTGWVREESARCRTVSGQPVGEVFCLVKHAPAYKTLQTQVMTKPASCREVTIPAEYQMVRRQKLVRPATTRKVTIPAEFDNIEKTVVVAGGMLEWQRVVCEINTTTERINSIKDALHTAGYNPGPADGEFGEEDWEALKKYQLDNRLGVGALTLQTLDKLGVDVE